MTKANTKFCVNCGSPIGSSARFCESCGSKVSG
jgi:predicted amidophosphoribosyltransferase